MKIAPGKFTDPRFDKVWEAIQGEFRSYPLKHWVQKLHKDKSTISRQFAEIPSPDSLAYRYVKAIHDILELVDIFGLAPIEALAEPFGAKLISPQENLNRMIDDARRELSEAQERLRLAKQRCLDIEEIRKIYGVKHDA